MTPPAKSKFLSGIVPLAKSSPDAVPEAYSGAIWQRHGSAMIPPQLLSGSDHTAMTRSTTVIQKEARVSWPTRQ